MCCKAEVRYQSAIDDGLTESLVCSLERPVDADGLSPAERSALRFADLFATDHLSIDDTVYDDLRRYFTEDELVELGVHCAYALGIGRVDGNVGRYGRLARRIPVDVRFACRAVDFRRRQRIGLSRASAAARVMDSTRSRRNASASTRAQTSLAGRGARTGDARHSAGSGYRPSMCPSTNLIWRAIAAARPIAFAPPVPPWWA